MGTFGTIGFGYVNLIESAGDQGLVAFGGYTYPGGEKLSVLAARQNDTTRQVWSFLFRCRSLASGLGLRIQWNSFVSTISPTRNGTRSKQGATFRAGEWPAASW